MQVTTLSTELWWKEKKKSLPAIAGLTPEQMLDHYSLTYPELATATVTQEVKDGKVRHVIGETLGTKG